MYESMFSKELIDLNNPSTSSRELFDSVASVAHDKGYARKDYGKGLIDREAKFPTGLMFPSLKIALPHVDPEFVLKPFIYVVKTNTPIGWKQMGDMKPMSTNNFLFLGIKEPSKQVGLLAQIMSAFKDQEFVKEFLKTTDETKMYHLLSEQFTKISVN
ncbi:MULTISPECIES: PTS sugar transporter subunit IIA [Lacticaseibacillus]|uniref:PTS sugar transporter subunit IIA n=2 Tax=Lacticaseibacillus TaxID=2759736 RepID=A0AAN1EXV6_LACCA|nr:MULTISPECIES: PTS sugar transporter subunit IIA [Lacticaseibacillus]ARY90598.1 PTS sugar transporter subunit IIA [Lacticaseibacillus casei]KAB1970455.1 PTS sugar transporter subunit IIA [Lacticaseibacillus casei]WLV81213.1 PTS sugar transporter subunit IIA [Lacticaseibacillus sp. NCIMB 15473]WNX25173.1 PTS sugar transporter subunit IIA [Lacticaseibacillus casei]WNX27944.1 PTS sugar transporter subunit IIA [Lacticaseibacillus casei]